MPPKLLSSKAYFIACNEQVGVLKARLPRAQGKLRQAAHIVAAGDDGELTFPDPAADLTTDAANAGHDVAGLGEASA